jgi:hypothetical protein
MTTERVKETVSKYVAGMEYIKNVCGKSGGRIVQQDFRQTTKLSAIVIKGMVHLGYLKKISRGVYAWNLGDIVEPKAARNVHEYVLNYFKQNAIKRENKVVEPKEEDLMAQDLIPSTPEEDIEALKDWINDLCKQKTDLIRELDEAQYEVKSAIKWIDELRLSEETWRNMYNDVLEELTEMKDNHNAIVKDIMDTPQLICTSEDNEPASKTYYFLGIPLWSIKFK